MEKRHWIKMFEISSIVVFSLIVVYLLATGILSSSGFEHSWPYPSK